MRNGLVDYLESFKKEGKSFDNVFQIVSKMVLHSGYVENIVNGKPVFDYNLFRSEEKHLIGLHEEINSFVSFVRDAAASGSSAEMAYVLVGEPGNGKTFFVEYLCQMYRRFLLLPENKKFTFMFTGLDKLDGYGRIKSIESQTYEDPMILAMNLFEIGSESKKWLSGSLGFSDVVLEKIYENYRPLGACSEYILRELRIFYDDDMGEILKHIKIVPVPISDSLGTLTGKYPAKDKITSSAVDLLGEESIQRLMNITDTNNPYRFDLRRGALARVAGGGIHFSDELFKNKKDLIQVYLGLIQNRTVEVDGFKWPIDTLIIATSNNSEFNRFLSEKEEAPIIDRCRISYVSHNTNVKLQEELTKYIIGSGKKITVSGDDLHCDPNLNYAASITAILSRMPKSEKLTPIEMMKLASGEVAGEKSVKVLSDVIDDLNRNVDITRRFGQRGLGQRNIGRSMQILLEMSETQKGQCMFGFDFFKALESVILDYITDPGDRKKFLNDLAISKGLYRERIMTEMFNAYMDQPNAIKKDVLGYVNMIIGIDSNILGADKQWKYKDPQTGKLKSLKIDERFIDSVEERLGLKTHERKDNFRTTIRKIYGQKISTEPDYDFMDNLELVKAVTDVRLKSDISGAGSLVGALANRTNEENEKLYNRLLQTMVKKLGYCNTCAEKTIEYFCTQDDV